MNMHVKPVAAAPTHNDFPRKTDKELIALCRRTARLLENDRDATTRLSNMEDLLQAWERENAPTREPAAPCLQRPRELPSVELRDHLRKIRGCNPKDIVDRVRERIAAMEAFEKACKLKKRDLELSRAERAAASATAVATNAVALVAQIAAVTPLGLAEKAALMGLWFEAGYGWHDEGEDLARSIFFDARMLGTGGPLGGIRAEEPCAQQAHH